MVIEWCVLLFILPAPCNLFVDHIFPILDNLTRFSPFLPFLHTQGQSPAAIMTTARAVLANMFSITRLCHGSSVLSHLLNEMWISLMYVEEHIPIVVPEIVDFFLYEHMKLLKGGIPSAEDEALLKMIFVHLTRSGGAELITKTLMKEFRKYLDQNPRDPLDFLKYHQNRRSSPEPLSASERSAFHLVSNLMFEHGHLFIRFMPLLLQNSAVCCLLGSPSFASIIFCIVVFL